MSVVGEQAVADITAAATIEILDVETFYQAKISQLQLEVTAQTLRANTAEKALAEHIEKDHEGEPTEPPPTLKQVFGTSYGGGDESMNDGRAEIGRCFWNGTVMPNSIKTDANFQKAYAEGVRVFWISWKSEDDAEVEDFLNDLPKDCTWIGTFHHEVENDVKVPSPELESFKKVTKRHYALMRKYGVHTGQVFMQYSLTTGSGRNIKDYFVEGAEFVGIDGYINPKRGKSSPENMVDRIVTAVSALPGVEGSGLTEFAVNNDNPEPVCYDLTDRMRQKLNKTSFMVFNTYWPSRGFEFASQRVADAWFDDVK